MYVSCSVRIQMLLEGRQDLPQPIIKPSKWVLLSQYALFPAFPHSDP